MRLGARFQQDRRDQKSGEYEKQVDSRPSPERCLVEKRVFEAWVAVIEDDAEDGDAPQSLQFGNVRGEPGWALDEQE